MILNNFEITNLVDSYEEYFKENNTYFPAKIIFIINRNIKKLRNIYIDIVETKDIIIKKYGILQEDGSYNIPEDKLDIAQKELDDLSNLEQEVQLNFIYLDDLNGINLTPKQIEVLDIMIKEEKEN